MPNRQRRYHDAKIIQDVLGIQSERCSQLLLPKVVAE
jgi:hypothetical protein